MTAEEIGVRVDSLVQDARRAGHSWEVIRDAVGAAASRVHALHLAEETVDEPTAEPTA